MIYIVFLKDCCGCRLWAECSGERVIAGRPIKRLLPQSRREMTGTQARLVLVAVREVLTADML